MSDLKGKRCAPGLFSSCSKRVKERFGKYGPNTSPTVIATASVNSSFLSSTSFFPLTLFLLSSCLIMVIKKTEATYLVVSGVHIPKNAVK